MKRFTLLLGCLCIPALAQQARQKNPVLLDTTYPPVYLLYDHQAEVTPNHPGEKKGGIWLSIHNNTRAAISIRTQPYPDSIVVPLTLMSGAHVPGIRNGLEIAPLFSLEEDHGTGFDALPLDLGDRSAILWIPEGGTVLMSVPNSVLTQRRRVALPFSYEWEPEGEGVTHQAYFYGRDIKLQAGNAALTPEPAIVHPAAPAK